MLNYVIYKLLNSFHCLGWGLCAVGRWYPACHRARCIGGAVAQAATGEPGTFGFNFPNTCFSMKNKAYKTWTRSGIYYFQKYIQIVVYISILYIWYCLQSTACHVQLDLPGCYPIGTWLCGFGFPSDEEVHWGKTLLLCMVADVHGWSSTEKRHQSPSYKSHKNHQTAISSRMLMMGFVWWSPRDTMAVDMLC